MSARSANPIWPRITSFLWMLVLCFALEGFTEKTALPPGRCNTEILFIENQKVYADVKTIVCNADKTPHTKKSTFVFRPNTHLILSKLCDQACQLAVRRSPRPLSSLKKGATPYTAKSRLASSDDSIFSLNS